MNDQPTNKRTSPACLVLGAILLLLNLLAVVFSAAMLDWAVRELQTEGGKWGLVGVFVVGGPGLAVQLLLLALTICLVCLAKRLSMWVRLTALLLIAVAVLLDWAALFCASR
jgi:hypothetical protein